MTTPPTVLYIVGKGRSGSTIVDNALGGVPDFFTVGELHHLWDWGLLAGYRCGCGEPVSSCPFWTDVIARTERRLDTRLDPRAVVDWQQAVHAWPRIPRLLGAGARTVRRWPELRRYVAVLEALYAEIAAVSGANVIVDATKWPTAPTPLGLVPSVDVRLVHLVRDPRAVVHSWQRRKALSDRADGAMPRRNALTSMISWTVRNLVAERVGARWPTDRWLRVRYEDVVTEPAEWFGRMVTLAGHPGAALPLEGARTVVLGENHTVGGNEGRMRTGPVELRPDDEWMAAQTRGDRSVATLLALPLLRRYGYPVRASR